MRPDVAQGRAIAPPAFGSVSCDGSAVLGPSELSHLSSRQSVGLRGVKEGVIGRQPHVVGQLPTRLSFNSPTMADVGAIDRRGRESDGIEDIGDLVIEPLAIAGERGFQLLMVVTERAFEAF